jgi:hypothetical protein
LSRQGIADGRMPRLIAPRDRCVSGRGHLNCLPQDGPPWRTAARHKSACWLSVLQLPFRRLRPWGSTCEPPTMDRSTAATTSLADLFRGTLSLADRYCPNMVLNRSVEARYGVSSASSLIPPVVAAFVRVILTILQVFPTESPVRYGPSASGPVWRDEFASPCRSVSKRPMLPTVVTQKSRVARTT